MASFMLSSRLLSMLKPLSFLKQQTALISSFSVSFNACRWSPVSWNMSGFKQSNFLIPRPCLPEQQYSEMKTKSVLRKRCKDCYIVKRRGTVFIYCKSNNKHKQRQG